MNKNIKKYILPQTSLGKWSVRAILLFFLFMAVFYLLVHSGQRGGDTFFSNPTLTIPILLAAFSAITALITGVISTIKEKEKSILVFLAILLGLFVAIFILGEIITPH